MPFGATRREQASKAIPPDASDIGNTIRNRFYGTKSLDTDDVDFTALRLHATYRRAKTDEERTGVLGLVEPVIAIYDILGEMPVSVLALRPVGQKRGCGRSVEAVGALVPEAAMLRILSDAFERPARRKMGLWNL